MFAAPIWAAFSLHKFSIFLSHFFRVQGYWLRENIKKDMKPKIEPEEKETKEELIQRAARQLAEILVAQLDFQYSKSKKQSLCQQKKKS